MSMYKDLANELSYENDNLAYDNSILKDDLKALVKWYEKLLDQHQALLKDIQDGHEFNETDLKCLLADYEDFEQVFYENRIYLID